MKYFVITIDTEPDAIFPTWHTSCPLTFKGVFDGVPLLQKLAEHENVKLTYLLQPVILQNSQCISIFNETKEEIGTHLHGDYIEPFPRYRTQDFSGCDPLDMQKDYSPEVEFAKLITLTNLFTEKFNERPRSFRAGRFGIGKNTLQFLKKLDYTHDTSIVPGWKNFKTDKKRNPYLRDGIIEVPVTTDSRNKWLRPTKGYSDKKDLKKIISWISEKQIQVACCMFHNVELVPGISPYCGSKEDQEKFIDRLKNMIHLLRQKGYESNYLKNINP